MFQGGCSQGGLADVEIYSLDVSSTVCPMGQAPRFLTVDARSLVILRPCHRAFLTTHCGSNKTFLPSTAVVWYCISNKKSNIPSR